MHPKTAVCLAQLEKSLQDTQRLLRRLTRLSQCYPPVYWQLDGGTLHTAQQLLWALQHEKEQLLVVQRESEGN